MKAMKKPVLIDFEFAAENGEVEALGGKVSYKKGDAIITGVKGEKYPCRRDIFDQTYSIVDEGHADITIKFTKEELTYLLSGAYLAYREYKDSQDRWPYPPAEVANECANEAYKLYKKIRKAYDEARNEEKSCPILARLGQDREA